MDVASFERAAQLVLGNEATDPALRQQAQHALIQMGSDLGCIAQLQSVLDTSSSSLAVTAAAQALTKLVTEHWNAFKEEQRVQIRACCPPSCPPPPALPPWPAPTSLLPLTPPAPLSRRARAPLQATTCWTCWPRRAWPWSSTP
jgi:hypothetical protein